VSRPLRGKSTSRVGNAETRHVLSLALALLLWRPAPLSQMSFAPRVVSARTSRDSEQVGCTAGTFTAGQGQERLQALPARIRPQLDYHPAVHLAGRRFNRADPEEPECWPNRAGVAHGGGRRFAKDPIYKTSTTGSRQASRSASGEETSWSSVPNPRNFSDKPGEQRRSRLWSATRTVRRADVTRNNDESGVPMWHRSSRQAVIHGERVGEPRAGPISGRFGAIPVTVLNPKPASCGAASQHNYVDGLVERKTQRLKLQPSPPTDDVTLLAGCARFSPDAGLHRRGVRAYLAIHAARVKRRR